MSLRKNISPVRSDKVEIQVGQASSLPKTISMLESSHQRLPIAVLISGGGTTLYNLIEKIAEGKLHAEIRLVVSSNPEAKGLQFAKEAGIKTLVVEKRKELSPEAFSEGVFGPCRKAGAKLVVMGGFLKHV